MTLPHSNTERSLLPFFVREYRAHRVTEVRGGLFAFILMSLLYCMGCSPASINAGFPEVPLEPAANSASSAKIGIARVEDSRPNRSAGLIGTCIGTSNEINLLVGPELPDYIEREFRNELATRGITSVDALNPAKTGEPAKYKTIVVTLQSVSFATSDPVFVSADSSVNIAVQVYELSSTKVVFGGSYSGTNQERIGFRGIGMRSGAILAVAANRAVDAAFADVKFEQALK
jgi:hypothetical protein